MKFGSVPVSTGTAKALAILAISCASMLHCSASAQEPINIGVITGMSGPYAALSGPGTVLAVQMAVDEMGGKVLGRPINVLSADHQYKPDIAVARAREWYDRQNVQMIVEAADSASAVALQKLGAQKKRITFFTSGTTALTNQDCSPYGVHYSWDTYSMAGGAVRAAIQAGGKSWYFITADYVFGHTLESDATKFVKRLGGNIVGEVKHPLNTADFASYLVSAQQSGAQVVALANSGSDTQISVKQAREFGLEPKQRIVPLLMYDTDVMGMGLETAQGMEYATSFYWDYDDRSREFGKKFYALHKKSMPTMNHAGSYSATLEYLKAVEATGTIDADTVMKYLKSIKIDDAFARHGYIRDDGTFVHDIYLVQVKTPKESTGPTDLLRVVQTISGDDAFQPLAESTCPLLKK